MKIIVSVINDLVTDQRVHKVCTTLSQKGYEIELVGRQFKKSESLHRQYGTHRMRLLFNKTFFFFAEYNIRLFFHLLFSKADAYLSNDTDTLVANYLVSRIRRKPLIFDAHEMFPEMPEVIHRKLVRTIWTKVEDWIFPQLKYSYTVCQSIADVYNTKYNMNMRVIRNIPFARQTTPVGSLSPIDPKGKKVLLYQGAVNIGRGIEWVIDAMPYLNDFVFYVIGDGDVLEELKAEVKARQLEDRVLFTGRIPFEQLPAYTACADIGVNLLENRGLNYYYSLPNRIFDFIRKEIPVLACDFPEIKRIVSHYDIGILIDHYEPEYLAKSIKRLAEKEKNIAGFASANAELTWENESVTLLNIMNEVFNWKHSEKDVTLPA